MAIAAANGALLTLVGLIIVSLTLAHPTQLFRPPTRWDGMAVGTSVVAFIVATVMMPAWHKDGATQVASAADTTTPGYVVAQQFTATQPPSNTSSATTAARAFKPAPTSIQLERFQAYWREHFGMPGSQASWYGRVARFEVLAHRQLVAYTNLSPDADGQQAASTICVAMAEYVFTSTIGLDSVWVWGQDDSLLAQHKGPGAVC